MFRDRHPKLGGERMLKVSLVVLIVAMEACNPVAPTEDLNCSRLDYWTTDPSLSGRCLRYEHFQSGSECLAEARTIQCPASRSHLQDPLQTLAGLIDSLMETITAGDLPGRRRSVAAPATHPASGPQTTCPSTIFRTLLADLGSCQWPRDSAWSRPQTACPQRPRHSSHRFINQG